MESVFFSEGAIVEICVEDIDRLKEAAEEAPLRRARICLHQSHDDPVQEMIIAFMRDSYVRPHRHAGKSESFHLIEGRLDVVFFDDEGSVTRRIPMAPFGAGHTFAYRLSSDLWHTVIPRTDYVILHETTTGPFMKDEDNSAPWSPEPADAAAANAFLERLREC